MRKWLQNSGTPSSCASKGRDLLGRVQLVGVVDCSEPCPIGLLVADVPSMPAPSHTVPSHGFNDGFPLQPLTRYGRGCRLYPQRGVVDSRV